MLGSKGHVESLGLEEELRNVAVDLPYLIKVNCIIESNGEKKREGGVKISNVGTYKRSLP